MIASDILSVAAAVVAALGGGAAIVFALSSWLGKVWANRLMEAGIRRGTPEIYNKRLGV